QGGGDDGRRQRVGVVQQGGAAREAGAGGVVEVERLAEAQAAAVQVDGRLADGQQVAGTRRNRKLPRRGPGPLVDGPRPGAPRQTLMPSSSMATFTAQAPGFVYV